MSRKVVIVDDRCGLRADVEDPEATKGWDQVVIDSSGGTFDLCPACMKATLRFLETRPAEATP